MALYDVRYRHWRGRHEGIWRRRLVIAGSGLRDCLRNRWMRYLITMCWMSALVNVAVMFCIGQLLVADSIIVAWAANLNPTLQMVVGGLTAWLEEHPEISVRVTQNLLFYRYATFLLPLSLVAVALAIPRLITRDLSSNAIIVYASKAVSRFDYLLGKAGIVFGLLSLTWLGPILASWLVGNLLAPDWHFFWHSRAALGNVLLFVVPGMVFLVLFGLGVSAVSPREKATVGIYIVLWLVGNALVPLGVQTKPWLKQFSFHYDLQQLSLAVFRPANDLKTARDHIPFFGDILRNRDWRGAVSAWQTPDPQRTWPALTVLAVLSTGVVLARTKPE